jgi:hypothetical protein
MVYTETKYATVKHKNGFWIPFENGQDPESIWKERLRCCWKAFFNSTKESLLKINNKFVENNRFSKYFQLVTGNHLYDINPSE